MTRRPRPVLLIAALAAVLLGTACGTAPTEPAAAAPGAGFPVTVPHALGTAEIPAAPQRVVALSPADADAALAVGITPVAVVTPFYTAGADLPWQAGRLDGSVTRIAGTPDFSIDVEAVAAARPDLVLGTGAALTPDTYGSLSAIGAPVLAHLESPVADRWEDLTTAVGTATGRTEQAAAAIAQTRAAITAARDRHPGLNGRTFSFSVIQSPTALGTVVSDQDFLTVLFGELGLRLPDTLAGLPESAPGAGIAAISQEKLGDLAADLVLVVAPAPQLEQAFRADPRTAGLGSVHTLDLITATSLRTPSVLSVPWGLDQLDGPLSAVAGTAGS